MTSYQLIVFGILFGSLHAFSLWRPSIEKADSTLELVHVIFRHGNRNPSQDSLPTSNPFYNESFYPEGYEQLTNAGKRTEYRLGQLLRQRYDDFLGPIWNINTLDVRTTDVNRTKMSAELMLAGLYRPRFSQIWSTLPWQPIPYNYYPTSSDKETYPFDACGTKYATNYAAILNSAEITDYIQQRYNETLEYMSQNLGETVSFSTAVSYYNGYEIQEELGYPLPAWLKPIYPEILNSMTVDNYFMMTNTTALRRTLAGYFLRKVLADTKSKIDGTLSPSERKMFIYSAHDMNIGIILLSLEAYKITNNPKYGSHMLFEVHNVDGVYGLKLFFQDYKELNPIPVKIPGCDYFCPYDDFVNLVSELIPESDEDCYGS